MTAAIYFVAAVILVTLATRAWLHDQTSEAHRSFMALGWLLATAYLSLALSFLPGLAHMHVVFVLCGAMASAYANRATDLVYSAVIDRPARPFRVTWLAWPVVVTAGVAQALFFADQPRTSPAIAVAGILAAGLALEMLVRLERSRRSAYLEVARTRLGWLVAATSATVVLSLLEWASRTRQTGIDETSLPFFDRGLVLHGVLPPMSPVLTVVAVYVLYHVMVQRRLVAFQEIAARGLTVGIGSAVLLLMQLATQELVQLSRFPLHAFWLNFLVSAALLSVWVSVHPALLRAAGRLVQHRAQDLTDAVQALMRSLPTHTTADAVAKDLVASLMGSGRFQAVAVYLFDPARDAFQRMASGGVPAHPPLEIVSAPTARAVLGDTPTPVDHADAPARMRQLATDTDADLLLPLTVDGDLLGWVSVRDEPWSDGFSTRELRQLGRLAALAARVSSNLEGFRRVAEARRLAAVGTLSAGLAHEIRNPLAGLKGAAQYLGHESLGEDAREMLDVILHEVERLDDVVSQFLDYARPLTPRRGDVDLARLTRRTLDLVRRAGLPDGVTLTAEVMSDLPPAHADESQLAQVLLNLVRNAVEAVGDTGTVVVEIRPRDRAVELVVRDDGPGVDADLREQLFTPFCTSRPEGTGLGLAVSRRIMDAHGGSLDLRSPPGAGAVFVARLPRDADEGHEALEPVSRRS